VTPSSSSSHPAHHTLLFGFKIHDVTLNGMPRASATARPDTGLFPRGCPWVPAGLAVEPSDEPPFALLGDPSLATAAYFRLGHHHRTRVCVYPFFFLIAMLATVVQRVTSPTSFDDRPKVVRFVRVSSYGRLVSARSLVGLYCQKCQ